MKTKKITAFFLGAALLAAPLTISGMGSTVEASSACGSSPWSPSMSPSEMQQNMRACEKELESIRSLFRTGKTPAPQEDWQPSAGEIDVCAKLGGEIDKKGNCNIAGAGGFESRSSDECLRQGFKLDEHGNCIFSFDIDESKLEPAF